MFLHGVEVVDVPQGVRPVSVIKSGVIGLVGISPLGAKNQVILVTSDRDATQFGAQVPGFTIPQSLDVIFAQGAGSVLVVNVFDEATHTVAVTAEPQTVTQGKLKLAFPPIGPVTVLDSEGAATTYVKGTHYNLDAYGNFSVIGTSIANAVALKFTYKKLDLTTVNAATIVGSFTPETQVRTGIKAFDLAYSQFGINPKILIAPGFSSLPAVSTAMITAAEKFRAITYIDASVGTTVTGAIAGRGPAGTFGFNTSNKRAELVFPHLKKYDPATNAYANFAYSAYLAGVRAVVDNTEGFWVSSSNREIKATTGPEFPLSASLGDITSDANILNEAGITSVFNTFGTGNRTWGNRNASFPTNTAPDNFSNIVRLSDVVDESLQMASLQFVDQPITQGLIDSIRATGNAFIRVLIGRGALLPGSIIKYNKADNPPAELAAGHLTFEKVFMGPTPAELITIKSVLDINLFSSIS